MRNLKLLLLVILSVSLSFPAVRLRQVAMVDLSGNPGFNQVAMAHGEVVMSRPETDTIEIFSPLKRRIVARISQVQNPRGIAVDDSGGRVYAALAGSSRIAVINSANWQVERLVPVKNPPEKLLWVPSARLLYVSSVRDRSVSALDPRTGAETTLADLGGLHQDMVYDALRQRLLVSLQDLNEVAVLDRAGKLEARFKLAAFQPTGLALEENAGGRRLFVAARYAILTLNADTGAELSRIAAPGGIDDLVLDESGKLLYGVSGDGSVLTVDLARHIADELPTDLKGYGIAYDPGSRMLFFPGGREGRAKILLLRPSEVGDSNPVATRARQDSGGNRAATPTF